MKLFSRGKPQIKPAVPPAGSLSTEGEAAPTLQQALDAAVAARATPEPETANEPEPGHKDLEPVITTLEKGASSPGEDTSAIKMVADLSAENAVLKTDLSAAEAKVASSDAVIAGLTEAAKGAIAFMQVALGQSPSDLSAADPAALGLQYSSIRKDYEDRIPVGQSSVGAETSPTPTADNGYAEGIRVGILPKDNS